MGTDKQTDLDPSCVTHTMKDQRQTDDAANGLFRCTLARGTASSRRSDEQKWWRRAGGLESRAAAIKVLDFPQRVTVRIGIKSHLSGVTGAGGAY